MREEFARLANEYPNRPVRNDGTFAANSLKPLVERELVNAIELAIGPRAESYIVRGSVGKGDWTHTPWVVLLDPAVTTSVERNYYVVYLLSLGSERLYLSLAQGCTTLKNALGIPGAKLELARRAAGMRDRAKPHTRRLGPIDMDLGVDNTIWRGKLYEAGCVIGKEYDTRDLPTEAELRADLAEALLIYRHLKLNGGWAAEDSMVDEANEDQIPSRGLEQAKVYRQHRTIERDPGHSREVKRRQGTRCRACDLEMEEVYGSLARGVCDAHHLKPLSTLRTGEVVTFDPMTDFTVLCPSCHRAIHRMPDASDLGALRDEIRKNRAETQSVGNAES